MFIDERIINNIVLILQAETLAQCGFATSGGGNYKLDKGFARDDLLLGSDQEFRCYARRPVTIEPLSVHFLLLSCQPIATLSTSNLRSTSPLAGEVAVVRESPSVTNAGEGNFLQ